MYLPIAQSEIRQEYVADEQNDIFFMKVYASESRNELVSESIPAYSTGESGGVTDFLQALLGHPLFVYLFPIACLGAWLTLQFIRVSLRKKNHHGA